MTVALVGTHELYLIIVDLCLMSSPHLRPHANGSACTGHTCRERRLPKALLAVTRASPGGQFNTSASRIAGDELEGPGGCF